MFNCPEVVQPIVAQVEREGAVLGGSGVGQGEGVGLGDGGGDRGKVVRVEGALKELDFLDIWTAVTALTDSTSFRCPDVQEVQPF